MKIAICQLTVKEKKEDNIDLAQKMIIQATEDKCDLAVLPEMFNCPYSLDYFPLYAETYPEGKTIQMLARTAREKSIYLIGGSIPEKDGDKIFNTCFIFDRQGNLIGRYRKMHLFDVSIPGGPIVLESKVFSAGKEITVVETEFCRIGICICYDIRFPELIKLMVLEGAKVIIIPAVFNIVTGAAHWELLVRIRAVDNQVFLVGAAPARSNRSGYQAYSHSMIADPWGKIVACADEKERLLTASLNLELVEKIRSELPLLKHLRSDVYQVGKL